MGILSMRIQYAHFHKLARKYFNFHKMYSETIFKVLMVFAVVIAFHTVGGNAQLLLDKSVTHKKIITEYVVSQSE